MTRLELLKELTALSGPSGYERAVARRMLAGMRALGLDARMDRMGNVVGYVPGRSHERKVMVSAHSDEVGLMVKYITDDGIMYFDQNGTISTLCLPGAKVQIVTRDRLYTGVIGTPSAHLMTGDETRRLPSIQDMWIDVGARRRDDVLAMGIHHGTPIVFYPNWEQIGEGFVMSKAIDDRMGCALLLESLETLASTILEVDVYVVAVVQEEVGSRGARVAARRIAPDWAITVDTVPASDPSTIPQKTTAEVGKGPVFRSMEVLPNMTGTLYSEAVSDRLVAVANAEKLPYQRDIFQTWSDAATIHTEGAEGVSMGSILVPRRYAHSCAEVLSISDLEAAARLIPAFLKSLSVEDLSGTNWLD
jgi:putative aminopeptidase FrvX